MAIIGGSITHHVKMNLFSNSGTAGTGTAPASPTRSATTWAGWSRETALQGEKTDEHCFSIEKRQVQLCLQKKLHISKGKRAY